MEILNYIINEDQEGQRIDKYLSINIEGKSRSFIQGLIDEKKVMANDKIIKSNYKLKNKDLISYVDELALGECDIKFPYQVPENRYFVLGDHRATSIDSRSSVIGCVEKSQIVGKVFLRVWPLSNFSLIH